MRRYKNTGWAMVTLIAFACTFAFAAETCTTAAAGACTTKAVAATPQTAESGVDAMQARRDVAERMSVVMGKLRDAEADALANDPELAALDKARSEADAAYRKRLESQAEIIEIRKQLGALRTELQATYVVDDETAGTKE